MWKVGRMTGRQGAVRWAGAVPKWVCACYGASTYAQAAQPPLGLIIFLTTFKVEIRFMDLSTWYQVSKEKIRVTIWLSHQTLKTALCAKNNWYQMLVVIKSVPLKFDSTLVSTPFKVISIRHFSIRSPSLSKSCLETKGQTKETSRLLHAEVPSWGLVTKPFKKTKQKENGDRFCLQS
jgi:hypothetical protein